MVAPTESHSLRRTFAASTDTALCLIPPRHVWERVDRLRSLYDKSYQKWPPHINLVYPFVQPESLEEALHLVQAGMDLSHAGADTSSIRLTEVGVFAHKNSNTLYLRAPRGSGTCNKLTRMAKLARDAIGRPADAAFNPHMSIAQSEDESSNSHKFIRQKVRLLAPIEWESTQLAVLVRSKTHDGEAFRLSGKNTQVSGEMRLWGCIELGKPISQVCSGSQRLYQIADDESDSATGPPETTYQFMGPAQVWLPYEVSQEHGHDISSKQPDRLIVASYNVLAEFEWPPSSERHPGLVASIVSSRGAADILVLQEVTDHFLASLLLDPEVRTRYPYASRGPPSQPEIGPLPSLLNVVVLSKFPLRWNYLRTNRKHKGAVVATFPSLTACGTHDGQPLVVAACHLSQGLADGAVNAKKAEVQRLLKHLSTHFEDHPWVIAGDFNLVTSTYTLDMARQRQDLSAQSYNYVRTFNSMLAERGIQDTWVASRILTGESSISPGSPRVLSDLHEGEQGATFDPLVNHLAARMVGSGLNNRPQRYDRILVSDSLRLRPTRFNMFGTTLYDSRHGKDKTEASSDHWGIRCLLEAPSTRVEDARALPKMGTHVRRGSQAFGGIEEVKKHLGLLGVIPSVENAQRRMEAIQLLEGVLQCEPSNEFGRISRNGPRMILSPVGSFAMGCWTVSSDVDCLCIGEISSRTFFSIAGQRLRKAASQGITILRRVKATSGTMLELDIQGIRFDLQYCCAPSLLEEFPHVLKRPATDPAFALPPTVLSRLKPLRDLSYLQRSIPDLAQYAIAHLFLRTWAKNRGLFGAKFGLLGSIHISVLLVPICKTLALELGSVSVGDIITTFFHHYASFDWKNCAVFDPFFHESLKYHRTFREPLCLLGWHSPSLNTAPNASVPTATTLAEELRRADRLLGEAHAPMDSILGSPSGSDPYDQPLSQGAVDFVHGYKNYVKVDVHYWGSSSAAGAKFVGWLESRCVMLLVDLSRKAPSVAARIWPQRFTAESGGEETDPRPSCHGCYLIGLTWQPGEAVERSHADLRLAEGSIQTVLREFENRIRGDCKYFDADTCWMSADVVRRAEVSLLGLDDYHPGDSFGEHGLSEEDEGLSDDEDEDKEEEKDNDTEMGYRHQRRLNEDDQTPRNVSVPGKFRTARDVMNRVRWDPALDSSDYIIGYEDRFVGTREKQLELWRSEQTDEEFIPQHRILYFKRRSDDVIVWERRLRVDVVFGSGVSG